VHDVCGEAAGRIEFMTFHDFQLLPEQEQIDSLYQYGVYIGKRKEAFSIIVLYQFESFYVEVYYRKYRSYVKNLHCFESTELLDPYLEQIDVENLV
jgi:hypothetical protein